MLAAVSRAFGEPPTIEEVELAPPSANEVTVRVAACGICHSDVSYGDGAWEGTLPAVYGHEVSGVVTDVGAGVDALLPGDRVVVTLVRSCGQCYFCARDAPTLCEAAFDLDSDSPLRSLDGTPIEQGLRVAGFAERVTVHASQVVPLPDDVAFEGGCLLACAVPSGVGAVSGRVVAGDTVVVVGTGGVGLNSVQGAAVAGAATIVAVDVSSARLDLAKSFGATHAIHAGEGDVGAAVPQLTEGRGADCVVVTAAAKAAIEGSLALVRRGGTVVLVGMPPAGVSVALDPGLLAHDGTSVVGSKLGSLRPHVDLPNLVDLYRAGRLKLDELVSERYRLEEIDAAIAASRRGDGVRNVIVFRES